MMSARASDAIRPDMRDHPSSKGGSPPRASRLTRSVLMTVSAKSASLITLLALTPVLTRELGPEKYGLLLTIAVGTTILSMADLGIGNGLISRLAVLAWPSTDSRRLVVSTTLALAVSSCCFALLGVLAAVAMPWQKLLNFPATTELEVRTSIALAGAAVALTVLTSVGQKIDIARQRTHVAAAYSTISTLSGPALSVVVATLTDSLLAVVATYTLVPTLPLLLQTLLRLRELRLEPLSKAVDLTLARESVREGASFLALALISTVSFSLDPVIVAGFLGPTAAGYFSLVVRLFAAPTGVVQAAMIQLWPAFAEATELGEAEWIERWLRRSTLMSLLIGLLSAATIAYLGDVFLFEWMSPSLHPEPLLIASAALWAVYSITVQPLVMFLNGARMQNAQVAAALPVLALNLGLSLHLTHELGSAGPLLGSLIANGLVLTPILMYLARRRLWSMRNEKTFEESEPS